MEIFRITKDAEISVMYINNDFYDDHDEIALDVTELVSEESKLQEISNGYIYTFEDLQNRLREGGDIILGDNITIPQDERINLGD